MTRGVSIVPAASRRVPRTPFAKMKERVLGRRYELSVAFVNPRAMRALNRAWRKKDAPTDILSFPLAKDSGEILLCMPEVTKKAGRFGMSVRDYLGYVFIHGLLHLEGHEHGRTMSALERKFSQAFHISVP